MTLNDHSPGDDSLIDFGDDLVSERNTQPHGDIEATMLRVQHAAGVANPSISASIRTALWKDLMNSNAISPTTKTLLPVGPTSSSSRPRFAPQLRQSELRWQSGISLAIVAAFLIGLVAIVYQNGPVGDSIRPSAFEFGQIEYDPDDPSIIRPVSETCQSNGPVPSDDEIKAHSMWDWAEPQPYPDKRSTDDVGTAVLLTYLNYMICSRQYGTEVTPGLRMIWESPEMTSYYSDRYRLSQFTDGLAPVEQQKAREFLCYRHYERIETEFPFSVNRPGMYMNLEESVAGEGVDVALAFDPTDVYRISDGRYGVIVGGISTAQLMYPNLRTDTFSITFFAFVEKDGRYYIDQEVPLFMSDQGRATFEGSLSCP